MLKALQSLPKWMGSGDFDLQQRIAVSSASIVYVLDQERWLDFKLPAGADRLRLVSNASIAASLPTEIMDAWQYALEYQILDENGDTLLEKTYHKRAGLNQIKNDETNTYFQPVFYLRGELEPLAGQSIFLNLEDIPDADRLRIRLASSDPEISDAVVRVYHFAKIPKRNISLIWRRMAETRKEDLASGNIYPLDLLTKQEVENLMLTMQSPLAPMGVERYAYQSRVLYSMRAFEGERIYDPITLHGVLINKQYRGVIPIPENGGRVRLEFDPAYETGKKMAPETINIRWFGRTATERSTHRIVWQGNTAQFEQNFSGGLLEISAQDDIVVSAFLINADSQLDITPETVYLRGYTIDPESSVSYQVAHAGEKATPLRLDFRYLYPENHRDQKEVLSRIEYSLIDETGRIFKQDSFEFTADVSAYDRIAGETAENLLSEPVSRFFLLPSHVKQIRFRSNNPVLVFAYNRPSMLVREIKVPESAYVSVHDEWNEPAWFPVRPINYKDLILTNHSLLLTVQPKPAEDKSDLLAGRYQWEDYHPQGDWLARYVFTPLDAVETIREEAFFSVYQPVMTGKNTIVNFQAPPGVNSIMPRLVYFRQQNTPFELSIFIDDALFFKQHTNGRQGEMQLPAISAGRHTIKVITDVPVNVMLSHAQPSAGGYLRRLANRFNQSRLTFVHERKTLEEESLSARLYMPYGRVDRTLVRVQISNIELMPLVPMESWSFDAVRFDVRAGSIATPVMGTQAEHVDYGYPFFLTLGENLPLGNYFIDFFLEDGVDGGYLSLAKVTPGVFEEREIYIETEVLNVSAAE